MLLLELLLDPFVAFCVVCIVTPIAVQYPAINQEMILDYLIEPSMLFTFGLLLLVVIETTFGGKTVKLTASERMRARWYLLNGAIIHILMDGMVGLYKTNALMAANYQKLDKRYGEPIGSFRGSVIHIVSACELFIKGPICLLLYRMYHRGSPHRELFEFFTCVTQVYGTIVYLGQEFLTGFGDFDPDWELTFSLHHLVYFWFAVAVGCILYFLVPGYLGYKSYMRMLSAEKYFLAAPASVRLPVSSSSAVTGKGKKQH